MKIINLTQHKASSEQLAAGVFDLQDTTELKALLTFTELPSIQVIEGRSKNLADLAKEHNAEYAMIGGAGYLMPSLEKQLLAVGITPLHAFTQRVSVENVGENGEVIKTNVFKHVGFVGCN